MEGKSKWELRQAKKSPSPFTAINSTSEDSKYFVSMLQYKLMNKNGEGADEDFTDFSWCGRR